MFNKFYSLLLSSLVWPTASRRIPSVARGVKMVALRNQYTHEMTLHQEVKTYLQKENALSSNSNFA